MRALHFQHDLVRNVQHAAHAASDRFRYRHGAVAVTVPLSVRRCSATGARNQRGVNGPVGGLRYVPRVGHLLGYARVSTAEQSADLQVDELTAAGCWKVWTDSASGVLDRRPQLDEVLGQVRPGDTLVVWRLDRLGRSLRHLIDVVTGLDERGVGFRSLREHRHHHRRGAVGVPPVRGLGPVRAGDHPGPDACRAGGGPGAGRSGGRPSKLTAEQRRQAFKMYDARELTVEQIGQVLGVSRTSIYRALADSRSSLEPTVGEGSSGDAAGSPSPSAGGVPRRRRRLS